MGTSKSTSPTKSTSKKAESTRKNSNKRPASYSDSPSPVPSAIRDKGKNKQIETIAVEENAPEDDDHSERPTAQRVTFHLTDEIDQEDDDDSDRSSSADLLAKMDKRDTQDGEQPEGFLTAKNSSDAYFLAHGKANPTSTNLFSARPNRQAPLSVSDFLQSFDPQPLRSARSTWNQWTAELLEGYSILFYGLGSKRATLNEFVEQHLVKTLGWEGLVINGFQAGCDLSSLLNDLEEIVDNSGLEDEAEEDDQHLIRHSAPQKKASSLEVLESRAQRLCGRLNQKDTPSCVLLLHNLDGLGFRNSRVQTILGLLAAQPRIHFLATIDHINAPILLASHLASARPSEQNTSAVIETFPSSYNFLYHHLPTATPYTLESLLSGTVSTVLPPTIFPPTMISGQNQKSDLITNGAPTAKATLHVLSSLTEKAKLLFRLLAEHQISRHQALPPLEADRIDQDLQSLREVEERRAPKIAISATALFELARAEFVTSALTQMQALLVEFRDHAIILAGSSPLNLPLQSHSENPSSMIVADDQEWLWIGLPQKDLEEVLSKLDDL
ncbi:hypothetical protein PCANC_09520 [Puccinia coronata f. sp. avenae]|uniref:Origin recognition complex subunit 2 n=1 Tax=Puccinia coronata f. sp. avenae TaxID=200324 RepID=A0A2N5TPU2_9BASI|nr:hypothetical protein PCASD_17663 [Puccinia coronata f. sp. avenae]PLW45091.1 hypothetical protein PCANC_09520 [Puccinia coronata f. sp. avenae]